jgi:N-acetylglucosamine-6-phosphate deacetylase
VEGPFIDRQPGYVGAHPPEHARPADLGAMQRLLDAAGGLLRLVTLAPEHDAGFKVTRYLADQGIIVSAGHCNPSLDQLRGAIDAGLTMFTHLGNGCPMQMHRHENIIQRVLSLSERLWISFIADGAHVDFTALGNYLRCVPEDRAIITTDAISAAGCGAGQYQLGSRMVEVGEDLVVWGPGKSHLVGSAITMPVVVQNLKRHLGFSDEKISRLVGENARTLLAGAVHRQSR